MMKTKRCCYRVDRRHINFIRFIFEAYEGIAVVTTLKPDTGLIALAVAPGCEATVQAIMADIGTTIMIEASLDGVIKQTIRT